MATKAGLQAELERLQYIRDAQIDQIAEQRKEIEALEQEVERLQIKKEGHNKGKAGRPTASKELIQEINRLRDVGMSYKKISHKLNIAVATAHKYSKN